MLAVCILGANLFANATEFMLCCETLPWMGGRITGSPQVEKTGALIEIPGTKIVNILICSSDCHT